ncbi:hypothetical protein G7Y79_00021g050980 [Physcia stellaris]|nr:hypothetical protein G7Y79_00021g050980 [Physcia stellaris]
MASTTNDVPLEEYEPFLADPAEEDTQNIQDRLFLSAVKVKRLLYTSHFLSTWNSRLFEFGAVLFLAHIFPKTLLPSSVYAIVRAASAICFSPSVGSYIDRAERLKAVRISIVVQRVAVIASCLLFWVMSTNNIRLAWFKPVLFGVVCVFACAEKICAVMNLVAVERDWVVVISESTGCELTVLNSQMRRIDLFCKLVGPLMIALVDGFSIKAAIWTTMGLSSASVLAEYFTIAWVHEAIPALQLPRIHSTNISSNAHQPSPTHLSSALHTFASSTSSYIYHSAFLPSLSLSLLYLTVLSFSAQMLTYLLSTGVTSLQLGFLRTISSILEISATWFTPLAISRIGPIRSGLWSIGWQASIIITATSIFWTSKKEQVAAAWLVAGVILSRVGLWGFDLSVQIVVQEEVEAEARGSFSSTEASLQNLFELFAYATTIVWARPDQFRYPVLVSTVAILVASGLYASFVRRRRGHLTHLSDCIKYDKGNHRSWGNDTGAGEVRVGG